MNITVFLSAEVGHFPIEMPRKQGGETMNMKRRTSLIILLLTAGMVISLPVASVYAQKATQFTGTGETIGFAPGTFIKQMGVNVLVVGNEIYAEYNWDSPSWVATTFGEGDIVNTVDTITNLDTEHTIFKGTFVMTFDTGIELTGSINGKRMIVDGKGFVTTGTWVGAGNGYKVIWHFDSRKDPNVFGVIIEL
jgi:hypothetical protein